MLQKCSQIKLMINHIKFRNQDQHRSQRNLTNEHDRNKEEKEEKKHIY